MAQALHIVVAIDSFKGSATSMQAATWVADGIHRVDAQAQITKVPIADGGEGTVEALTSALGGMPCLMMPCAPRLMALGN